MPPLSDASSHVPALSVLTPRHGRPERGSKGEEMLPLDLVISGRTFGQNTNILCHSNNNWSK